LPSIGRFLDTESVDRFGEITILLTSDIGDPEDVKILRAMSHHYDVALVLEPAWVNGNVVSSRKGGGI